MSEVMNSAPPYVSFIWRAVEDRNESIKQGRYIAKDVAYAQITPAGSRDTVERVAETWLKQIAGSDYPPNWVEAFRYKFEEWRKSGELLETGTPIKNWCVASPAQIENCLRANIYSVEQLAEINEEGLARLGMGGRALKDKAKDYLRSANDIGRTANEISELKREISALKAKNTNLMKQVEQLKNDATGNNK